MTVAKKVDLALPASLSAAAAVWEQAVATMAAHRTLDAACLPAVERYCTAWLRWKEAESHIATEGAVVPAPKSGVPMANVWHAVAKAQASELRKLEAELGLLPGRRTRALRSVVPLGVDGLPLPPEPSEFTWPETAS